VATETLTLKKTGKQPPRKSNTTGFKITRKAKKKDPEVSSAASATERHRMIAEAAYSLAEQRGFQSGQEILDWLEAEKEIDRKLGKAAITAPA
jgi:hypothetical protein